MWTAVFLQCLWDSKDFCCDLLLYRKYKINLTFKLVQGCRLGWRPPYIMVGETLECGASGQNRLIL